MTANNQLSKKLDSIPKELPKGVRSNYYVLPIKELNVSELRHRLREAEKTQKQVDRIVLKAYNLLSDALG